MVHLLLSAHGCILEMKNRHDECTFLKQMGRFLMVLPPVPAELVAARR